MAKKPKDFSLPPSFEGSPGTDDPWKDAWEKMADGNQKTMAQYMEESHVPPYPWLEKDLFKPEKVMTAFMQTMQAMSPQAEGSKGALDHNFIDVQAFLSTAMNGFQKEWDENPFFFLLQQSWLLNREFLKETSSHLSKLDPLISQKLASYMRQLVDVLSLNPGNLQEKVTPSRSLQPPPQIFELGKNLALTPGKVVFQNELFQLIQYEALTPTVASRPLLIVPPWINKYYIFDLGVGNSFVQWALESGLTVFIISWINPDQQQHQKTIADYLLKGLKTALDQVRQITGSTEVNAVGYCAGGTLLGCLMAHLKARGDSCIASATLIAAPFDFSEIDPLGIYQFERHPHNLEGYVKETGRLEGHYIVQAFNLLRANDLIWSPDASHYLLGQIPFPFDMLHWTCDALRLPSGMHSLYLRSLFIENGLMKRESLSNWGIPLDFRNASTPLFVIACHEDQVAPWRSIYAVTQMAKAASCKFILSASGHATGAFTPPSSQQRPYWTADHLPEKADDWLERAKKQDGSWWCEWRQWLDGHQGGTVPARAIPKDRVLEDAPGRYATGKVISSRN